MQNNIKPNGLKGNEAISRMKDLMGIKPMNENTIERAVVEITKKGPDGKIYAIVRENHKYHIKIANKYTNIVVEDFQYIGGLVNKHKSGYSSYAEAIKQLNLSFISISESLGVSNTINSFLNDKFINENEEECMEETDVVEGEEPIEETEGTTGIVRGTGHDTHIMETEVELTPVEEAIDNMLAANKDEEDITENYIQNNRLKIGKAMDNLDENDNKNAQLNIFLETLSAKERLALIETLKKKA